jgi:catechol 2,3-dioxygenase-like lactoylglutathione lyase family enzyme
MKRFHVHLAVENLAMSIAFYSKLFGQSPSKQQPDYAKWMLDDPSLNFAISSRGQPIGINHFGMQAETPEELAHLKALANDASGGATLDQGETTCCYAKSEKHWAIDPQGLAWEHFLTLSDALAFGQDAATQPGGCCAPLTANTSAQAGCCISQQATQEQCCG